MVAPTPVYSPGARPLIADGRLRAEEAPDIVAIGVAKGVNLGVPCVAELADAALGLMRVETCVDQADIEVDPRWIGDDYAVPTDAGTAAIEWAARRGGVAHGSHVLGERPSQVCLASSTRNAGTAMTRSFSFIPAAGPRCLPDDTGQMGRQQSRLLVH